MSERRAVMTDDAPAPAGPYSQAVVAGGLVWLAGQTPRTPDGTRLVDSPLEVQARQVMDNLEAVAQAAGGSLKDAVKTTVYLCPGVDVDVVNAVYADYVGNPPPARTTIVSDLRAGSLEVDAVLWIGP